MLEVEFLKSAGFEIIPDYSSKVRRPDVVLRIRSNYKPGASEQPAPILPVNADVRIPSQIIEDVDADARSLSVFMPWVIHEIEKEGRVRFSPRQAKAVWRFASAAILCELDRRAEVGYLDALPVMADAN